MIEKSCDLCRNKIIGVELTYFVSTGINSLMAKKQKAEICLECYKKIVTEITSLKK